MSRTSPLTRELEVPAAEDSPVPVPTPESAEAGANVDPRHPVAAADVVVPDRTAIPSSKEASR